MFTGELSSCAHCLGSNPEIGRKAFPQSYCRIFAPAIHHRTGEALCRIPSPIVQFGAIFNTIETHPRARTRVEVSRLEKKAHTQASSDRLCLRVCGWIVCQWERKPQQDYRFHLLFGAPVDGTRPRYPSANVDTCNGGHQHH